jgi:hypothetical protein
VTRVLVGTEDGIRELDAGGVAGPVHHAGRSVTALGAEYPDVWAILARAEVWKSNGSGWTRRGVAEDSGRLHCIADTRAGYLVGTSQAHLLRVTDDGLEPVDAFERVSGREGWYTPWGGPPDLRSLSEDADVVLANVHVGGIPRTLDEGATWEPTIDVDADVHRVWARDGAIFAACARGLAVSDDRGDSWTYRTEGLHSTYCRAVALAGDAVLLSAADGPRGGHAALYRGARDGSALERCTNGLPDWFDDNIDSAWLDAIPPQGVAAFGTGDGRVFLSSDEGSSWAQIASDLPSIHCLLLVP